MNKSIWTKDFIFSCIGCFLLFANFYMLLSAMPMAVKQLMDGTAKDMSLIVSIYVLGIVLLRPFSGVLADKFGKRKVSIVTIFFFIVCTIGYLGLDGIFPLLIVRLIHGVFHSVSTTAHAAMAIDMVPGEKKGEGIGYYGLAMSLSMVLGPALGIYLLSNYSYETLILVASAFAVISFITTLFVKKKNVVLVEEDVKAEKTKLKFSDFIEPKAIPVCISALVFAFSYSSLISFMAVYTEEIGAAEGGMYFFMAFAVSILLTRPMVGKLLDTRGPTFLIYPSLVIFAFGTILLSVASSAMMVILVGLIMGVAYGAIFPSLQTITVRLSPSNRTGVATATFFLFYDAGFGSGAFFLAIVASTFGYSTMYQVVSGLIIITLALYYFLYHRKSKQLGVE